MGRLRRARFNFVAGVVAGAIIGATGQPLAAQSPKDTLISVGAYRLHFRVFRGGEPTVLLESGGGFDASQWNDVAPRMVQQTGATVVAYDRAGFGGSDLPEEPYDIRAEVAGLWAGLEHLGLNSRLILVGHSYGAFLIQLTAHQRPQSVHGLVYVDPNTPGFMDAIGGTQGLWALIGGPPPPGSSKAERAGTRMVQGFESTLNLLRGTPPPSSIPVRVITAGQGWLPTPESQRLWRVAHDQLAASVSDGRLFVAEQSGHMISATEPELIIRVVRDLIGR